MRHLAIFLLLFIFCPALHAVELTEGLWQLKVKRDFNGLPVEHAMSKYEQCLSENEPIPFAYIHASDCDVLEKKEKLPTFVTQINQP